MNALKGVLGLATAGFVTYLSSAAHAAPTGLALGLERSFGFAMTSMTTEAAGTEATQSSTEFTLGLSTSSARIGVDYVLRSGLSLGTGVGYGTASFESETDLGSDEGPTVDRLLLAPRVGYMLMFTRDFGLWPRGGFTFSSTDTEMAADPLDGGDGETSRTDIWLTLEAPLVIMPTDSFGFTFSPSYDLLMSSSMDVDGNEVDADISGYQFGVLFGVFGVL